LQPLPIRYEFILVQFCPGFDESMLTPWERTTDQLNGVNAINAHIFLVVCVKMWPMMWHTGFRIHANNNSKKAGEFWHDLIISQVVVWLCLHVVGPNAGVTGKGTCQRPLLTGTFALIT
jgi:hypothetical protein